MAHNSLKKNTAVGIDFGTSKCAVAISSRKRLYIVLNDETDRTTPVYFGLNYKREIIQGKSVKHYYDHSQNGLVFGLKCHFNSSEHQSAFCYAVKYGLDNWDNNKKFPLEYLIRIMFETLRHQAVAHVKNMHISTAVITVPDIFGKEVLAKLKKMISELFEHIYFIKETWAAAVAYVDQNEIMAKEENVLILNYGGGGYLEATYFPSLSSEFLQNSSDKLEVDTLSKWVGGGGEEIKCRITNYLVKTCTTKSPNLKIDENPKFLHDLRLTAEHVMHGVDCAHSIHFSINDASLAEDISGEFSPKDFENLTSDIFGKVETFLKYIAKERKVRSVVLTGGSTRLRPFRKLLWQVFPQVDVKETVNAEEAAVEGAAVLASHVDQLKKNDGGEIELFTNSKHLIPR